MAFLEKWTFCKASWHEIHARTRDTEVPCWDESLHTIREERWRHSRLHGTVTVTPHTQHGMWQYRGRQFTVPRSDVSLYIVTSPNIPFSLFYFVFSWEYRAEFLPVASHLSSSNYCLIIVVGFIRNLWICWLKSHKSHGKVKYRKVAHFLAWPSCPGIPSQALGVLTGSRFPKAAQRVKLSINI